MIKNDIKEKIKQNYIDIFNQHLSDIYIKKDLAEYDEYDNVNYIGPEIETDDLILQFFIRKTFFRLKLYVKINKLKFLTETNKTYKVSQPCYKKDITLYHDIFHLKKKTKLKIDLLKIVKNVEIEKILKLSPNRKKQ